MPAGKLAMRSCGRTAIPIRKVIALAGKGRRSRSERTAHLGESSGSDFPRVSVVDRTRHSRISTVADKACAKGWKG